MIRNIYGKYNVIRDIYWIDKGSRVKCLSIDTPITNLRNSFSSKNNSGVPLRYAVNARTQCFCCNHTNMTKNK